MSDPLVQLLFCTGWIERQKRTTAPFFTRETLLRIFFLVLHGF